MQHLKHCIVLSFFGSTHKLALLYWAKPGYVYTSLCTGVLSHKHYELGTTYLHTSHKYWQENDIHRHGKKKPTHDQFEDRFYVRSIFSPRKSSEGLHVNAVSEIQE